MDALMISKNTAISGMVALDVDSEELQNRLLLRGKDSGRPDDANPDIIRRRIEEYNNKNCACC